MSLAEAFRAEFQRMLSAETFDHKTCARLEHLARAASAALLASTGSVDHAVGRVMEDYVQLGSSSLMLPSAISPAPASETFGVKVIQEALAVLPGLMKQKSAASTKADDPLNLVRAIKEAREADLHDVAAMLEKRLRSVSGVADDEVEAEPAKAPPINISFDDVERAA